MNKEIIKIKKRRKKLKLKFNKDLRRQFVNVRCKLCKRYWHIRVNDKNDWKKIDRKSYVCALCK